MINQKAAQIFLRKYIRKERILRMDKEISRKKKKKTHLNTICIIK